MTHVHKEVQITTYDTKWIPSSARFVVLGSYARATGCIQIYELSGNDVKLAKELETRTSFKCGTFGASGLAERNLATGNFEGYLQLWDLDHAPDKPIMDIKVREDTEAYTTLWTSVHSANCQRHAPIYDPPDDLSQSYLTC